MKKKILIVILILILIISAGIIYLNNVVLPTKIKSLIVSGLQERTQQKITLKSLYFNLFKGLVLKNLVIYDNDKAIINVKEASCQLLILPVFKKRIIIPALRIDSPVIFLERKKDNTLNIYDLFAKKTTTSPPAAKKDGGFEISIFSIQIKNAGIYFQDDTLVPAFTKTIEDTDLILYLSLPASVKFHLKSEIKATPTMNLSASGIYKIPEKELLAKVIIQNIPPQQFAPYYSSLGVGVGDEGTVDAIVELNFKQDNLLAKASVQTKRLTFLKGETLVKVNSDTKADTQYDFKNKQFKFSGSTQVIDSQIKSMQFVGDIKAINAQAVFNNAGISSEKINATIWDLPVEAKLKLQDFSHPALSIDAVLKQDLSVVQKILKEKFNFTLPGQINGPSSLFVNIQSQVQGSGELNVSGTLDTVQAALKLEKIKDPITNISGKIEFSRDALKWPGINFKYQDILYNIKGALVNFKNPNVELALSSKDLSIDSNFIVTEKIINFSRFNGRYFGSNLSASGEINATDFQNPQVNLSGTIDLNLAAIKESFRNFKDRIEKINPQGMLNVQFGLEGNVNNLKSCDINAKVSSASVSAYGFKSGAVMIDYAQADGIASIPKAHIDLYGGRAVLDGQINLLSENNPYSLDLDIKDVDIAKLKMDTGLKDKDISGLFYTQARLNGFLKQPELLSGVGKIQVTNGKLWQLDLFKGIGSLVFVKDFSNIVFKDGHCSFAIRDKYITTDNLVLQSDIANLVGPVKIGFDNSIEASLNVEIIDDMVPVSGTFRDVATVIAGKASRLGMIEIRGTLKEPKYKFKTAVADLIKGLKDILIGK